tara:strand:+ start:250 stop:630 length:381 start_codon:yes stop_codon:yes gene_type:complete
MAQSKTKQIMKKNLAELQKMRTANNKKMLKDLKKYEKEFSKLKNTKAVVAKRKAKKSIARRIAGKVGAKAIPGVGAAIVARDVVKAISKKTCISKGGKIVNGKCKGGKADKRKIVNPKARDLKSKR